MISVPEVVVERVVAAIGSGEPLADLAAKSARAVGANGIVAVVAATFSNPERFPSLAVRVAASLGLPPSVAAFDLQMACSAYPYAIYLAGRLSADLGGKALVIDGDVQSPLVDENDHATGKIFSDACTATVVSANPGGASNFDFLTRQDEALLCASGGPIKMDGFKVFSFVATEVSKFLKDFLSSTSAPDFFVPHQANMYMVRQLAVALGLDQRLLSSGPRFANPGSCSVPLTLAAGGVPDDANGVRSLDVLLAAFGAGLSASAARLSLSSGMRRGIVEI